MRRYLLRAMLVGLLSCLAYSQNLPNAVERTFPFTVPAVRAALQNLGAFTGSRLPTLDGFANLERVNLKYYQRPYYEFKFDIQPKGQNQAIVRVRANVSAWYTGPDAADPGYRALESNGRLENDLLDRLSDYLRDKTADAPTLQKWIASAKQERVETEQRTAELESQMKKLENPQASSPQASYVVADRTRVSVLSAPNESASVILKTELDDEFEIVERRGAWLRIKIDESQSGWVRAAQVRTSDALPVLASGAQKGTPAKPGFQVMRENTDEFSGDWARLKGKKALYIWARPDGSAMNLPTGDRLQFVQKVFSDRYREMAHSAQDTAEGIVVIFMDDRGGVAAASLDDIRQWVEGGLTDSAFLKRCSLDPPGAFHEAPLKEHEGRSSRASTAPPPGS